MISEGMMIALITLVAGVLHFAGAIISVLHEGFEFKNYGSKRMAGVGALCLLIAGGVYYFSKEKSEAPRQAGATPAQVSVMKSETINMDRYTTYTNWPPAGHMTNYRVKSGSVKFWTAGAVTDCEGSHWRYMPFNKNETVKMQPCDGPAAVVEITTE